MALATQHRGLRPCFQRHLLVLASANTIFAMYRHLFFRSAAAFLALLLLAAPSAFAQSSASPDAVYTQRVQAQIVEMLNSDDPKTQKQGISLIQQFADRENSKIDPTYFADRLSRMYFDEDQNDDVRMGALDALHAMDKLESQVSAIVRHLQSDPSTTVRTHTLRVLSQYNSPTKG
ncbi:hypothetical protein CRI94_14120 [Longibacter salinarum]|uniref:HEAT repeat domain-containing protein n=2 Tax=Longibacter salinarum TaxID=1850348 RepID=A0A2A8CVH1_9BACT|nr:hypothetical protein CRI94_14120 [Longibacter salinarum]